MKHNIKNIVTEYEICERKKGETMGTPGLMNLLPIPKHMWAYILMDFIEGLSKFYGKSIIMVVVD